MSPILECVPNFSEGRDEHIIHQITEAISMVSGVKLLNIDMGWDANRTVVTFAGEPNTVVEAAFQAVKKASELIDMRIQKGEHPRFGATDVCPLVPVSGISMEEAVWYARQLAKRIGEELAIPVYCYEFAAFHENRRSLSNCRSGEYEGLKNKLSDPKWIPDFGPVTLNERAGAIAVGARNFLIAYNVNLNTKSVLLAQSIAEKIRESGRIVTENGIKRRIPGTLKNVRAIGWYMEEYQKAQVSMNLTDISVTPVHKAYEEVCRAAEQKGVSVTGSELIGLIPKKALLEAGKYFSAKRANVIQLSDTELIEKAVSELGLSELRPFHYKKRILEYLI